MRKPSETQQEYGRSLVIGALVGIALALAFTVGFFVRDSVRTPPFVFASSVDADEAGFPLIDEVEALLQEYYLRDLPDYRQRQYAAIRGMIGTLADANTFFIDPPVAQSESDVLAGTYGGIGVTLQRNEEGDFVLYPFPTGPAQDADIRAGDTVRAINEQILDLSTPIDAVDQMLRGEVNGENGVALVLERNGETIELFVEFDVINVPSVQWRILVENETIGYIQILRFTSRTPDEVEEAITSLLAQGANALIIDLRNNSGGLLQESIDVASIFLDGGVVLYEVTNKNERVYNAQSSSLVSDLPVTILVNNRTASAAELVAGAIQDRDRGILIGQTTFGKGTIQQIFQLSDASSVHITSAEWFTPARNALDGVGLTPDIEMIPDENGRDIEIGEAIRYLQDILIQRTEDE